MGLFPSLPVTSHQGSTLNFEKLQRLLNSEWNSLSALGYKNSWEDFEVGKRLGEYRIDLFGNVMLRGSSKVANPRKQRLFFPDFHPEEFRHSRYLPRLPMPRLLSMVPEK